MKNDKIYKIIIKEKQAFIFSASNIIQCIGIVQYTGHRYIGYPSIFCMSFNAKFPFLWGVFRYD